LGKEADLVSDPKLIDNYDIIILPGVGAFKRAMEVLAERKLDIAIKKAANDGRRIIGFCLGMQLLFSSSKEGLPIKGLSLLPGRIEKIKTLPTRIGWNSIHRIKSRSLFNEFDNKHFYFNHTYAFKGSKKLVSANSNSKIF
jgi:glutamine amidotransferase